MSGWLHYYYCNCVFTGALLDVSLCLTCADTMAGDDHYLHTTNQVNSPLTTLLLFVQHCIEGNVVL